MCIYGGGEFYMTCIIFNWIFHSAASLYNSQPSDSSLLQSIICIILILFLIIFIFIVNIGLDATLVHMGPLSPPDLKPDTAALLNGNAGTFSPGNNNNGGGPGSPGAFSQISLQQTTSGVQMGLNTPSNRQQYPPNHPLSGSKHLCSICGDRASGKHYGVYR